MGITDINEIKKELTNKYTIDNDRKHQLFQKETRMILKKILRIFIGLLKNLR